MAVGKLLVRMGGELLQVARTLHTSRSAAGTLQMPKRLEHIPEAEVNMLKHVQMYKSQSTLIKRQCNQSKHPETRGGSPSDRRPSFNNVNCAA